eukprot:scaffold262000_cov23-Tisochrysis_lutea.AAC.2
MAAAAAASPLAIVATAVMRPVVPSAAGAPPEAGAEAATVATATGMSPPVVVPAATRGGTTGLSASDRSAGGSEVSAGTPAASAALGAVFARLRGSFSTGLSLAAEAQASAFAVRFRAATTDGFASLELVAHCVRSTSFRRLAASCRLGRSAQIAGGALGLRESFSRAEAQPESSSPYEILSPLTQAITCIRMEESGRATCRSVASSWDGRLDRDWSA